jgi:hypothetical protein
MTVVSIVYTYRQTAQKERERGKKRERQKKDLPAGQCDKVRMIDFAKLQCGNLEWTSWTP